MKKWMLVGVVSLGLSFLGLAQAHGEGLSNDDVSVLKSALKDEYQAKETYMGVIGQFGNIRPFTSVVRAEQKHIDKITGLFDDYSVDVPAFDSTPLTEYASVKDACQQALAFEQKNASMYDELLKKTDKSDIKKILKYLRSASRNNHIPAFERCLSRY